jgi:hypothetical protein
MAHRAKRRDIELPHPHPDLPPEREGNRHFSPFKGEIRRGMGDFSL